MTDANTQEESTSFFSKIWNPIKNVLKNIPGIGYFMRKTDDVIEAGKAAYNGDLSMAGAHVLGYDEMLSVKRNERYGVYEKATRLSHLGFSGAIESVTDHLPGGHFVHNLAEEKTKDLSIVGARKLDLASNKSTLMKSLGAVSDKEWKNLRESLDTNEDGRMDQKEFDDALKSLDVNRDGKVDANDVAALGGREAALQRMMAFNNHSSDR